MSVRTLLAKKSDRVITIMPEAQASLAAHLLIRHEVGGLPVVAANGQLVGFLAERELVRALDQNDGSIERLTVARIMRSPAPTCGLDDALPDVMGRMTRDRLRHMVAMDGDTIVGIVSVGDMVKHQLEQLRLEAGVLRDYVAGQRAMR